MSVVVVRPHELTGSVGALASKSIAHRMVLLSALCEGTTSIACPTTSADIEATVACVQVLGATVAREGNVLHVTGCAGAARKGAALDCGESGSTLRFLLPVLAALGTSGSIVGHGRLAERPLSPLYERLCEHGAVLSKQGSFPLRVEGQLAGGAFELPGNVSSQYVSGLLMAAPLVPEGATVLVREPVESLPYIHLTIRALASFGVEVAQAHVTHKGQGHLRLEVKASSTLRSPGRLAVEGDWSNAAFWLAAGALSREGVSVTGLDPASAQGDRLVLAALASFGARVQRGVASVGAARDALVGMRVDVSDIPDLVPPLAAVAAHATGETRLANAGRLRLKESDRLATVSAAIQAVGGTAHVKGDDLVIVGGPLAGGTVDAANDHRIAMMAAVMATVAAGPVTISGAECVAKSYPAFFEDFRLLGGLATTKE